MVMGIYTLQWLWVGVENRRGYFNTSSKIHIGEGKKQAVVQRDQLIVYKALNPILEPLTGS